MWVDIQLFKKINLILALFLKLQKRGFLDYLLYGLYEYFDYSDESDSEEDEKYCEYLFKYS